MHIVKTLLKSILKTNSFKHANYYLNKLLSAPAWSSLGSLIIFAKITA